jgi:hypothetical protein
MQWRGTFYVRQGARQAQACNEIQGYARTLTFRLWAGQTTERMSRIRLVDGDGATLAERVAEFRALSDRLRSKALFDASAVSAPPAKAQTISTLGNVLAEADLPPLNAGEPILVERDDVLAINAD